MKYTHTRTTSATFRRGLIGFSVSVLFLTGASVTHAATPTVSITSLEPGTTVAVGTVVTFNVETSGFIGPSYILSDSFVGGSLGNYDLNSQGQFAWTPAPNDVGSHTAAITATDNSGDTASISITLDVVPAGSVISTTPAPVVTVPVTTSVSLPVTSVTTTTAATSPALTEDMSVGTSDSQVTELQQLLTAQGDLTAPVTGYYGSLTQAAVMKFQAAHNLPQLGIVGPETLSALNAIIDSESTATTVPATTTSTTTPVAPTPTPTLTEIQSEIQSILSSLSQVESQLSQLVG